MKEDFIINNNRWLITDDTSLQTSMSEGSYYIRTKKPKPFSITKAIDLDPWVGVGGTKAAMVYPANEETRRLFGSRGVTHDKDGLLRRCDPGFLEVQWVRPEHIDILQDFRELEGDSRGDRKTVQSGRESRKHWTPEVGGFNMEEDANRPRVLRD